SPSPTPRQRAGSTTARSRSSFRPAGALLPPPAPTPATQPPARAPSLSPRRRSPSPRSRSPAARPSRSPTATSSTGAQTWQAQEKSTSAGSLANLGASPSITVYAADGTGTLTTPTSVVSASQTGRTITFTYTAATGGINNGSVTLVVPTGWSAPSTTGANAGYSTSSAGTLAVAAQTITVSSLTIAGGSTFTITYGDTGS